MIQFLIMIFMTFLVSHLTRSQISCYIRSNNGKFSTSRKGKSPAVKADLIYKDVCLFPSREWTEEAKAKLVSSGMYVDD